MYVRNNITLDALEAIPVPDKTESYQPVGHKDLVDRIIKSAKDHFKKDPSEVVLQVNKHGNQLFGSLNYYPTSEKIENMNYSLGFRNSYNKSLAIGVCAGAQVIICSNLMFTGDIIRVRKHTTNVFNDLDNIITDLIMSSEGYYEEAYNFSEKMSEKSISDLDIAHFLGECFVNEEILNSKQLNIAKREMTGKGIGEFKYKKDAWSLYNACTESLKTAHPSESLNRYTDLHKFSKEYFVIS